MQSSNQGTRGNRRVVAVLEKILAVPVFLVVVLAIIECGRGILAGNMVASAAREGARVAAMDGTTNADVTTSIHAFMNSALGVNPSSVTVAIKTTPGTGNPDPDNVIASCLPGDLITVQVNVPFSSVALIPGSYLAGRQLTGQCALRHE